MTAKNLRISGVAVALLLVLASCGGSSSPASTSAATSVAPTTTLATTTTADTAATTTSTAAPGASTTEAATTTAGGSDAELIAEGKVLFEETASGIGCAYCHMLDATGNEELASPDIRGMDFDQIAAALVERALMTTLVLSDDDIRAVAAYLATLPK